MNEPAAPAVQAAKQRPRRSRLLFMLLSLAIVFLPLELGARLLGLGDPEAFGGSRLRYQQVFPPLFVRQGEQWRPRDPRLVDRAFPAAKGGLRVFVLGESAVAGLGYSENGSFSRALERRLRHREPAAAVVNAGIVALSSRQIRRIVQDLVALRASEGNAGGKDVFVLHVGNNEFLELHARRYAEAQGGQPLGVRIDRALESLRFYGFVKQRVIASRTKTLSPRAFSTEDLRLSESRLVEVVRVGQAERDEVVAAYLENLRRTVVSIRDAGAVPILATVGTNLEWAGKDDAPSLAADPAAALPQVEARLAAEQPPLERWKDLFQRALLLRALGRGAEAEPAFRLAKDQDPRLRRCLSEMNEGVRKLAAELSVGLVDVEGHLAGTAPDGIVGFRDLYDYVHYTPIGAERVAEAIDAALIAAKLAPPGGEAWVAERAARLEAAAQDALEVEEWLGWNEDRAMLGSKDLWKYEAGRKALDQAIADGKATPRQRVWAANGYALELGGGAKARELWEQARAADPALGEVVGRNLAWLEARGE